MNVVGLVTPATVVTVVTVVTVSGSVGTVASVVAVVVVAAALVPTPRRTTPGAAPVLRPSTSLRHRLTAPLRGVVPGDRRTAEAEDVADWCESLARRVRSGSSLRHAVEAVEPDNALRPALAPIRHRLTRGVPLAAVVAGDHGDSTGVDLQLALDMIGVAASLGGSPAEALDRTATTLRQRAADRADRRTQAAQARISAHVLTVVPLGVLALLLISDDGIRAATATPAGAACIAGGLVLNGLGWIWMRALTGGSR